MTREEFYDKYGDVEVSFSSYYKHSFNYEGKTKLGDIITVTVGGCSDDIYRYEVSANDHETISSIEPYSGSVWSDGKEIDLFYDF